MPLCDRLGHIWSSPKYQHRLISLVNKADKIFLAVVLKVGLQISIYCLLG